MNLIMLDETASTNTWLKSLDNAPHATVVACRRQSAGRGQRGNSWESEPGMNLTFSILARPSAIAADRQFAVSRAVALGVVDFLRRHLPDPKAIKVKWPNDIYVDDKKICGILIENAVSGSSLLRSIIGVGINVNQTLFLSDAPNPVSMAMITGETYDLDTMLDEAAGAILDRIEAENASAGNATRAEYLDNLWRRDGFYPYTTPDRSRFDAMIDSVDAMGFLSLRHADGTLSRHAFKEVSPVL